MKQIKNYRHLSFTARLQIEAALNVKMPIREIAKKLGVHISTVYREIKRGSYLRKKYISKDVFGESQYKYIMTYSPDIAERRYRQNMTAKGLPLKIGNDIDFAEYIEHKIVDESYSPSAVLGEIKQKGLHFNTSISVNTLYSYIEKGVFCRLSLEHLFCRGKKKRRKRSLKVSRSPKGKSIEQRPAEINSREVFGHWEMDCICGSTKSTLLVMTERMTRKEIIMPMPDQTSNSVIHCLNSLEKRYGKLFGKIFRSITCDNGSEFLSCAEMEQSIFNKKRKRTTIYFCHPYSAYERGINERANREIRRKIPKGTNLSKLTIKDIQTVESWINTYPRKILNFIPAEELFNNQLVSLL